MMKKGDIINVRGFTFKVEKVTKEGIVYTNLATGGKGQAVHDFFKDAEVIKEATYGTR